MTSASLETIASSMQAKLGGDKAPTLLVIDWLKSAIRQWAVTASARAFVPFDALMSRDRPFDELLTNLVSELLGSDGFEEVDTKTLLSVALADSLEFLRDENRSWATGRDTNNDNDFEEGAQLTATLLATFKVLQHLDSGRAIRFANDLLTGDETSYGFLAFGAESFPIRLFSAIDNRHSNSEMRSRFFTALFEWAARNTTVPQVIARFPEILLLRIEAIHGASVDQQKFDLLSSLFASRSVQNLQPIQVVDMSINEEVEDYGEPELLDEYAAKLSDLTGVHVGRFVREMPLTEKLEWLESETMRKTFWAPLNRPPIPQYNAEQIEPEFELGSALSVIFGGQEHAT